MNLGGDSVNVYAEAKSEYTRQLCQILTPAIQLYFLETLKLAKEKDTDTRKMLWNFQGLLQEIPDWSQDKVLRETEKIIRESNCDYLEELLTAVFIAHTKVLSAIRITTKQKKLQLSIPKLDHFLHRTLRETGRLLWGNAFLFAEQGSPIERQKNMRQVEGLIQEGIQQSIRSLLPVKTILREYLNDDGEDEEESSQKKKDDKDEDEEEDDDIAVEDKQTPKKKDPSPVETETVIDEQDTNAQQNTLDSVVEKSKSESEPEPEPESESKTKEEPAPVVQLSASSLKNGIVTITKEESPTTVQSVTSIPPPVVAPPSTESQVPTLIVETEPSVSFTNMDTIFDSDNPERNEIAQTFPEDIETIEKLNVPPEDMDGFEELA
jgi:hypothetical protein